MPPKKTTKAAVPRAASAAHTPTLKANGKKRAAAADDEPTATPSKKAAKRTSKAPAPAPAVDSDDDDGDAGDANEREILASLSDISDSSAEEEEDEEGEDGGANSSDEDEEDDRAASKSLRSSMASIKLPNSKDDATVKARLETLRRSKSSKTTPGVLYIGRLPHGFYESQLKAYLSQFGDVTRLRISRNKKTGASKHYAFVEFADADVAKIVQETMHNYLIDGRLLQVKEISKDQVHPELWVGANRKFRKVPKDRLERVVRAREKTEEEEQRTEERKLKREQGRRQKLKDLGIEYDFPGYAAEKGEKKQAAAQGTPAKKVKGKTAKA